MFGLGPLELLIWVCGILAIVALVVAVLIWKPPRE
jgi:hypothetical protein